MPHHHRSGGLRQSNKKNKRSKASKRSLSRAAGGKVAGSHRRLAFKQTETASSKVDRRHMQQQKRDAKRQALLNRKRGVDGGPAPPRLVGIISLGDTGKVEEQLRNAILKEADTVIRPNGEATVSVKFDVHKKDGYLTVLTRSTAFPCSGKDDDAAVMAALDLCRICDLVCFVVDGNAPRPEEDSVVGMKIGGEERSVSTTKSTTERNWDHLISEQGDRILAAVKGQGLPTPLTILAQTEQEDIKDCMTMQSAKSLRRMGLKRRTELKKYVSRFATTEFGPGKDKVVDVDLSAAQVEDMQEDAEADTVVREKQSSIAVLIRTLCTMSASGTKWVADAPRSYMVSDSHYHDPDKEELEITGYVRGSVPFDVNALVHIPNLGTFSCKSLRKAEHPYLRKRKEANTEEDKDDGFILSDPERRESLHMFATPDALEGEQNLIGFDEEDQDVDLERAGGDSANDFARPAGWSDYQAAWLDAVDDLNDGEDALDYGELAEELNKKSSSVAASLSTDAMDVDGVNDISEAERRDLIEQRRKDQKEHQEFPDEVQVDEDVNARDRFARYRSIKSFRKSFWDPKENLPDSYASVFHFSSFKATQRSIALDMKDQSRAAQACGGNFWGRSPGQLEDTNTMKEESDEEDIDILEGCVPSGSYITLTIEGVKTESYQAIPSNSVVSLVSLLPHENKVSVLHAGLCQSTGCNLSDEDPVKSKDVLTFRCGWRTWKARPVFSQNNLNCDKHKFERFLPTGGAFFAATFFGPVTYSPCPVLVFREEAKTPGKELVAVGSMLGADADRIVVKRIVLTGFPVRVHKRFATVKYMFYNPEDVKWFKPAGIMTKHGLHGHIVESVGEHGTMKCLFNAPIKQHDTVCLPLYKRIYPKYAIAEGGASSENATTKSTRDKNLLVVR